MASDCGAQSRHEWYRDKGTYKRDKQHAHQLRRKVFSAFLFQVIGNKHVLLAAIQHPICSAAQPATILQKFMAAWELEKNSDDYKKRVQVSERLTEERRQLKKSNAHAARQEVARGQMINADILCGVRVWRSLSDREKVLLDDFNSGKLHRARDACDEAFGWNKEMRSAAGSAASRVGRW